MGTAATDASAPLTVVQGKPMALRPTRVLLGWLSGREAIPHLLGRNPGADDNFSEIRQLVAAAHASVRQRPKVEPSNPVVSGDRTLLDQIAARPELQATIPDAPWTIEWVDLTRVFSVQKLITTEGLDLRMASVGDDPGALAELCLPSAQVVPPLGGFTDQDGLGITISSLDPNLRPIGTRLQEAPVATAPGGRPRKMLAVTFFVNIEASYVQIAHYQGRYFLRDGYHRAAGLLHAGMTRVPAVVVQAPSFKYITPTSGLFDYEIAFSDHAPILTDFWDDSVSANGVQPTTRKVVRIRAEQFVVQG
jgi:hypothetical protein